MTFFQYIKVLTRYQAPYRGTAIGVALMLMLDVVFSISWPLSFKYFVDALTSRIDTVFFTEAVIALILAVVIASVGDILRGYGFAVLSSKIKRDARQAVFAHLQKMSMPFFMQQRSRDLVARLSSDLSLLESAVTSGLAGFLVGAAGIVLSAALLFFLEWRLAGLTVIAVFLCLTLPRPLVGKAAVARAPVEDMESELEHTAQETILAQPVVKAFGLGDHFVKVFAKLTEELSKQSVKSKFLTYLVERAPNVIILTAQVLVMGLGLLMVAGGQKTLGTIIAFQGIFLYVVRSVQTLTQITPVLLESVMGLGRVQEFLLQQATVSEAADAKPLAPLRDRIEFRYVSFGYAADQSHLEDIDLTIRAGTFVAFVGASGCGKSTLLNLILRFYDPAEGVIAFDGVDIRQSTLDSLRGQISVVFQETSLFHLSLRENIRLGSPSASDQDVETAAKQAEIHQWIMSLPNGYDTMTGEGGARLSAGQRQRIAIARALIRQPRILLLDEATSALDPETESAINATLRDLSAGRTVISVTHRLASVKHADCIYFLEEGRVTEAGTHKNLLAARGACADLWQRQSGFTVSRHGDDGAVDPSRLRGYPILSELDPAVLEEVAQFFVPESYPPSRKVVTEGEMGDRFFLIARGTVEVLKDDKRVAVLADGDYFGEIALLRRVSRTATVRTVTPTLLLSLRDTHFQALLKNQPELEPILRRREADSTKP